MSTAAPISRLVTLELPPRELRRHLTVQFGTAHLSARLSLPRDKRKSQQTLAFASDELLNCRLEVQRSASCLWIGRTAFDLTATESESMRSTFEPHGLQVRGP